MKKKVLSVLLAMALVLILPLVMILSVSAAGGGTVWTASKCEFYPAVDSAYAKLVLTEFKSNDWSTAPESIVIDLGAAFASIDNFAESCEQEDFLSLHVLIDDIPIGEVEEYSFSFCVVDEENILSEMEVLYNDGTDTYFKLRYEKGKEEEITIADGRITIPLLGDEEEDFPSIDITNIEDIEDGKRYSVEDDWYNEYFFDVYVNDLADGETMLSLAKQVEEQYAEYGVLAEFHTFVDKKSYYIYLDCQHYDEEEDESVEKFLVFAQFGDKIVKIESNSSWIDGLLGRASADAMQGLDKAIKVDCDGEIFVSEDNSDVTLTAALGDKNFVEYLLDAWKKATSYEFTVLDDSENYYKCVWTLTIDGVVTTFTHDTLNETFEWDNDGTATKFNRYWGLDILEKIDFTSIILSEYLIDAKTSNQYLGMSLDYLLKNLFKYKFLEQEGYVGTFSNLFNDNWQRYPDHSFTKTEQGNGKIKYIWDITADETAYQFKYCYTLIMQNDDVVEFNYYVRDQVNPIDENVALRLSYNFAPEWYAAAKVTDKKAADLICVIDTKNGENQGKTFADIFGDDNNFSESIFAMWMNTDEESREFSKDGKYVWTDGEVVWMAYLDCGKVVAVFMQKGDDKVFFGDDELHIDRFYIDTEEGETKGHLFVVYKNIGEDGKPITIDIGQVVGEGGDGQNEQHGQDGKTPYIGANGNWWIGDTDTGVSAQAQGKNTTMAPLVLSISSLAVAIACLGGLVFVFLKKKKD